MSAGKRKRYGQEVKARAVGPFEEGYGNVCTSKTRAVVDDRSNGGYLERKQMPPIVPKTVGIALTSGFRTV